MALSKTQEAFITKVRAVGNSDLGVALDDPICCYLIGIIAADLGLRSNSPKSRESCPHSLATDP